MGLSSASEICMFMCDLGRWRDCEGEALRDDSVVPERVTGNEPRNLCAYDECTQDI